MKIREIFDACAQGYDQERPKVIPCFDLFYGTVLRQIPFQSEAPIRVLDLGAGTGLVSSFIGQQFPHASFLLVDISEKMLDVAKDRFKDSDRHEFRVLDSRSIICRETYDVIVSALSIHHLTDEEKQDVYTRIFHALKPGGVFLHAEQVLAPTAELEALYQKMWVEGMRANHLPEDRIEAALERIKEDRNTPLELQLGWLRDIGFYDVDCWFKYYRFAVFGGRK